MSVSPRDRRGEPSGPSPHADELRTGWLRGWVVAALGAAASLGVLGWRGADVAVLALVGAAGAVAAAVAVHHLVVTLDSGERLVARSGPPPAGPGASRRQVLVGVVALGASLLLAAFGLRRFGPRRDGGTAWADGTALVTLTGGLLRAEDVPVGGVVTVWPAGALGTERAAVMVVRLREAAIEAPRPEGVVDGTLIAYSRLCTHAGCAVALYRDRDQALFCPCHQATFDARRGGVPTGGPASIALPQLPLRRAADGTLVAAGDLTAPPGPVGGTVRA